MKLLVYCILRDHEFVRGHLPRTADGAAVSLVIENDLAAAYSKVPSTLTTSSLCCAMAYARVVGELHELCTVVPLRYGCVRDSEAEIRDLLRRRNSEFQAALDEVEGCLEMGLHVLVLETPPLTPRARPTEDGRVLPPVCDSNLMWQRGRASPRPALARETDVALCIDDGVPHGNKGNGSAALLQTGTGAAYLGDRRAGYAALDRARGQQEAAARPCQQAFAGLYSKCLVESTGHAAGLSLHFLVPRENYERFREAFRLLQQTCTEKLLLSGPWPPYNFVARQTAEFRP